MQCNRVRHGCLLLAAVLTAGAYAAPSSPSLTAKVRSQTFDLEYRVNEAALPLNGVYLWYTRDKGSTWRLYGEDNDRQPPFPFTATEQGLHGFYLQIVNAAGASGPEPEPGTPPMQWAYVDYAPPIVQLHHPRIDHRSGDGLTVLVRWTALDDHLPPRPIRLDYRIAPDGGWQTIADNLANTGRYDWRVPDGLTGRLVMRVAVADLGGNVTEAAAPFDLLPPAQPAVEPVPAEATPPDSVARLVSNQVSEADRLRAIKLHQQARWHRDRGERRFAMARLRDALRVNPELSVALIDLASLLFEEEDYDASIQAYGLALQQQPYLRSALEGSARAHIRQRQFDAATAQLLRIVQQNPKDADAWLNLGDVAIYQGDELAARDRYQRAATVDPEAAEVIARARLRLANLGGLREHYQQDRSRS